MVLMNTSLDPAIEGALIRPDVNYAGRPPVESNIRRDFGIPMAALKKSEGELVFNPCHPKSWKVATRRRSLATGINSAMAARIGIRSATGSDRGKGWRGVRNLLAE
jgi:hypothetical protein